MILTTNQELYQLLDQLESEMVRLSLWSDQPPDKKAMNSQQPFCYDRMEFHEWLQWKFIPGTHYLLETGAALPENCGIAAMVDIAFKESKLDVTEITAILGNIDQHFSKFSADLQ